MFGVDAKNVGGDARFAGTENVDYCQEDRKQLAFLKRGGQLGEKTKEKDLVQKDLARVRTMAMEGSFRIRKHAVNAEFLWGSYTVS